MKVSTEEKIEHALVVTLDAQEAVSLCRLLFMYDWDSLPVLERATCNELFTSLQTAMIAAGAIASDSRITRTRITGAQLWVS